jgi:hypothetical protein
MNIVRAEALSRNGRGPLARSRPPSRSPPPKAGRRHQQQALDEEGEEGGDRLGARRSVPPTFRVAATVQSDRNDGSIPIS